MKNNLLIYILLALISLVVAFHVLIILKVIPPELVWGGNIRSDTEILILESFSIAFNLFLGWVLLMKSDHATFHFKAKIITLILRIFFILFLLNTVGNIFAKTTVEKCFAAVTLIFAILILMIINKDNKKKNV